MPLEEPEDASTLFCDCDEVIITCPLAVVLLRKVATCVIELESVMEVVESTCDVAWVEATESVLASEAACDMECIWDTVNCLLGVRVGETDCVGR